MLQAGDAEFQSLPLLVFNGIWESNVQPTAWQFSLMQPIYKSHDKDKTDPASYKGIYTNDTLAKPFEGLLVARLTTHTELNITYTPNQLGTKLCTQTYDATDSLLSTIQCNKYTLQKPTYVAFVDNSTAYPSVHRNRLSSSLLHNVIIVHMWYHLRARIETIRLRVLHPNIRGQQTVDISVGFLRAAASVPPYSAYLLPTSPMNSKLHSTMPLLILHLAYHIMGQRKFGLVDYFTLMTSRSCPLARTSCKPCLIDVAFITS